MIRYYWILTFIYIARCRSSIYVPPQTFLIGGMFDTYQVENKSLQYVRQEAGSQNLAAFVMAIDEINNKFDGIFDNILPRTKLSMIVNGGMNISVTYPVNNYIRGGGRAYLLRSKDTSLIATVDTTQISSTAAATAQTLNTWGILDLLSGSTSSAFAHSEYYPLTLQNTPSETAEANVLVDLIIVTYNWRYVTVIYSFDVQSSLDSYTAFEDAAASNGLSILRTLRITSSDTDFSSVIVEGIDTGANIFVLFMGGLEAGRLLEQGYNAGLFAEGTQVFTTSTSNIVDIRSSFTANGLANEANILKGLISTAPFPERYFSTPNGQSFITRFRNLPPTITIDPITKKQICNGRSDDSRLSGSELYSMLQRPTRTKAATNICLGFQSFKHFNQNGSNINPYTIYAYDAVYAYALALDALFQNKTSVASRKMGSRSKEVSTTFDRGSIVATTDVISEFLTASQLLHTMISGDFNYPAITTGPASFNGAGTRTRGNIFKLLNYRASKATNWYSVGGLAFIGEKMDNTDWQMCGDSFQTGRKMSNMTFQQCSSPEYRTYSGNMPPDDNLPVIYKSISSLYRDSLIFFASLALLNLFISAMYLFFKWNERHIRRSQPVLHIVVLIGSLCGVIKVLLAVSTVDRYNCVAQLWLQHISFRLVIRTLTLKLWRVFVIINSKINSTRHIGVGTLLTYITIDMVVLIILLGAVTGTTSNSYMTTIRSNTDDSYTGYVNYLISSIMSTSNNQVTVELFCSSPEQGSIAGRLNNTILSIDGIYVLSAIFYLIRTRDLPSSIHAAGSTGKALIFAVVVIIAATTVLLTSNISNGGNIFIINGSYLLIILTGGFSFFGKSISQIVFPPVKNIYSKILGKKPPIHMGEIVQLQHKSVYSHPSSRKTSMEGGANAELAMLEILCKEKNTKDREKACHRQICHWRAMLSLLSEEMIDGYGAASAHVSAVLPVAPLDNSLSLVGSQPAINRI